MSAWGGIDLDDETADNSVNSVSIEFDLDEILARAESDKEGDKEGAEAELKRILAEASQNGDDKVLHEILSNSLSSTLVDINSKDEAGSTALIYASCFGHEKVVSELLCFDADPNLQDANEWTALMWAANNNHLGIVKQLLSADADPSIKTSTGRTMFDLQMSPSSATYLYLSSNGYMPKQKSSSPLGEEDAFYEEAINPDQVEAEFNHNLMESAAALGGFSATSDIYNSSSRRELDLGEDADSMSENLDTLHTDAVLPGPLRTAVNDIGLDFDWDTFKVKDSFALPRDLIPEFLDLVVTKVVPTLQKKQTPTSANALFLATRYFFYCGTTESFTAMTSPLARRIEMVVSDPSHATDLAYLSYWLTNAEVLLYYIRKDAGLNGATNSHLQPTLETLINYISQQIQLATESLLLPLISPCLLEYNSIPEYGQVEYRDEWKIFRSNNPKQETLEDVAIQHMLPPSIETKWKKPGPQRVTSVLSSLLLLFQIFGVHPVTQAQIIAKLLYFMTSRLFNKTCSQRKHLTRRRAMQVRLNISVLEDWCRNHNFRPESLEIGGKTYRYKSLIDIGRVFLAPLNQILAWLQTFSGFGSDFTNVISTLQELKALNPKQLLQTATHYRFETRESPLSKEYKHYLQDLSRHYNRNAEEESLRTQQEQERKSEELSQKSMDGTPKISGQPDLLSGAEGTATASHVDNLLSLDTEAPRSMKSSKISSNQSCVLVSFELPVADNFLLDENLTLHEHIPFYEEAEAFWGDPDASGLSESQGARYLVPYIPAEIVDSISKLMEQDEEVDIRKHSIVEETPMDLEEPAMASKRPVDGEEASEDIDTMWGGGDDDVAPVWA